MGEFEFLQQKSVQVVGVLFGFFVCFGGGILLKLDPNSIPAELIPCLSQLLSQQNRVAAEKC